jgi:hypothetical protein
MSAGGLSYHGVIGHTSKMTLPSVETWGADMNILRDPPRSIQTRKIDRVGQTSDITQMIQESGDRACESILTYARGVNPMVGVSYGNEGNNGGMRANGRIAGGIVLGSGRGNSGSQSFLPYRIMNQGSFRPPARDIRQLLPLSRLPRLGTSSFTQPGFVDFSKKAMCPGTDENTKGVRKPEQMIKASIRPTAVYTIETPVVEPFEVKYVIKNPIQIEGKSGMNTQGQYTNYLSDKPTKEIIDNPMHAEANMNLGAPHMQKDIDLSHFDTRQYIHELIVTDANTNPSQNINVTSIEELYHPDTDRHIREQFNIDYNPYKSGYLKQDYIHEDLKLQRNLPAHESRTNIQKNIYHNPVQHVQERQYKSNHPVTSMTTNMGSRHQVQDTFANREYNLRPTITPGGYNPNVEMPSVTMDRNLTQFDNQKAVMRSRIYQMQQDRNLANPVFTQ